MTVKLQVPSLAAKYVTKEGTSYTPDTNGIITVATGDVDDLLAQGCLYPPSTSGFKNNFAATANPAVTDDLDGGYGIGSLWVNVTLDELFICTDASDGAAIWRQIGGPLAASLAMGVAAAGITFKQGANGKTGTFTANGATGVDVANTSVTATSLIGIFLLTPGGTVGAQPVVQTKTPSTGFNVKGTALDTSVYAYIIFDSAA